MFLIVPPDNLKKRVCKSHRKPIKYDFDPYKRLCFGQFYEIVNKLLISSD